MAHELDTTTGRAAIAFRGDTPWHGLGESILPQDDIDTIRIKAGLDYDVLKTPVRYERPARTSGGDILLPDFIPRLETSKTSWVLFRSDTGQDLSVVSKRYQVVQPREVIEFYRDLTEKFGFELEVVGALKGGRKVWALANTGNAMQLRDEDKVKGYLLLATSYDGTMATQARFTTVRVVCNNTLSRAVDAGVADVTVPHSTKFDATKLKETLNIGESWKRFETCANAMQNRSISKDETVQLFMQAYFGLANPQAIAEFHQDPRNAATAEKVMQRLTESLFNSPGAHLASARGTLWGALNAVTYDIDFALPSRSQDTRLEKAWFGAGNAVKQAAWSAAMTLTQ